MSYHPLFYVNVYSRSIHENLLKKLPNCKGRPKKSQIFWELPNFFPEYNFGEFKTSIDFILLSEKSISLWKIARAAHSS